MGEKSAQCDKLGRASWGQINFQYAHKCVYIYIYIYLQSPLSMLIYLYILKIKFNLCLSFSRNIFIKKINFSINQRVVIRTFCLLHHYPLSLQNTVQGSSYCMFSQYCFLSSLCTMVISRKENIIYMNTKYIWISFWLGLKKIVKRKRKEKKR